MDNAIEFTPRAVDQQEQAAIAIEQHRSAGWEVIDEPGQIRLRMPGRKDKIVRNGVIKNG